MDTLLISLLLVMSFSSLAWSGSAGETQPVALKFGDKAPAFALPDAQGNTVNLSDFKGRYVVLYFYPKDNTPGCTKEACSFRDHAKGFETLNAVILGVSRDTRESHAGFAAQYGLPFRLLADTSGEVVKAYGVWKPNLITGALGLGIERTTFLIDPEGVIVRIYPQVDVNGHVAQVLADLSGMK